MKTEYLLEKEVQQVLDLLTYENRLVMRTALHTGLRISDVLQLRPEQLKPNFWVTEQKTGKRRQIGLPEPLLSDLRASAGRDWVFPGDKPGKHRTRQASRLEGREAGSGSHEVNSECGPAQLPQGLRRGAAAKVRQH